MATQGSVTVFNLAKTKFLEKVINLNSDSLKLVLCTSSQSIPATFAGTSTNAQYSDLTAELTTANGYTAGGVALSSVTVNQSAGTVTFDAADTAWTLTGSITFKYAILYDNTAANKDLILFIDQDTGGGSITPLAGTLTFQWNAAGLFTLA